MEDAVAQDKHALDLLHQYQNLPPSPPQTEDNISDSDGVFNGLDFPLPPTSKPPTEVLDVDKNTPDSHVARDPRLIRLTGVHPFNVEAPLSALYDEGFLTSPELFYVRNHGAVPKVQDQNIPNWELSIEGYYISFISPNSTFYLTIAYQTR